MKKESWHVVLRRDSLRNLCFHAPPCMNDHTCAGLYIHLQGQAL